MASKQRTENIRKVDISYREINEEEQQQVTYLGCVLGKSVPMALKVINKINRRLKLLCRKNKFLAPKYLAIPLFSHVLTTRAHLGAQTLQKKKNKK